MGPIRLMGLMGTERYRQSARMQPPHRQPDQRQRYIPPVTDDSVSDTSPEDVLCYAAPIQSLFLVRSTLHPKAGHCRWYERNKLSIRPSTSYPLYRSNAPTTLENALPNERKLILQNSRAYGFKKVPQPSYDSRPTYGDALPLRSLGFN
jgi:hypothetical protein